MGKCSMQSSTRCSRYIDPHNDTRANVGEHYSQPSLVRIVHTLILELDALVEVASQSRRLG